MGEGALIDRIVRRAGLEPGGRWVLGIGDDAAVLATRTGEELVFTTDAQVEGVHFRFDREPARVVGRRALAVNLSDLAAMGASPVGALLSLSAPGSLALSRFDGLIEGFVDEAGRYGCPLVGGNLSSAERCSLHVTVIGRCRRGRALRRSGLRAGDRLFVTGRLGAAALARHTADRHGAALRRVPTPRLVAGQALAGLSGTRACIDLSDGLATDLAHLLEGTGFGADVDPAKLPTPRGFAGRCRALGLDPLAVAALGGEDYELLFALRDGPARAEGHDPRSLSRRLGVAVTEIGRVGGAPGVRGLPPVARGHHFGGRR
ncbi:MAG: thiamine-phosphate kinase [Spirochaetaceae bacterium]|nr:thiamine-phosphate kinase [Spirochaetaceae bacterium]